jgi:DNA invertase Pin-like site-specific DNA recombinase
MSDIPVPSLRRCAIYARKSTSHRLDHEINSIETQREVCAAYIRSQRFRGWVELPQRYDDGGHSGTGLERPALSRLMQDIEAGEVDLVVLYKVDRLTRSLNDFVRLIEIFDRHAVSFVSISQAFDTSDSMGRMILNVLLTFSQFEREMIADRVRDSIRSRQRHGIWPGGPPPFGYELTDHGLKVVQEEAEIVRFLFDEFLRIGTYIGTVKAARAANLCSTVKHTKAGVPRGGHQIASGLVYCVLRNPIYVGEIRGHGETYLGVHEPIISRGTWEAAKALSETRVKLPPHRKQTDHFLAGLLWDDCGRHMLLEADQWKDRRYYSYISSNAYWSQRHRLKAYRARADRLDQLVVMGVAEFLDDRRRLRSALKDLGVYGVDLDKLAALGPSAAIRLTSMSPRAMPELFAALVSRVEVGQEHLSITFRSVELRRFLLWKGSAVFRGRQADWTCSDAAYVLELAVCAVSAERWPVLDIAPRDPEAVASPDPRLVQLIQTARKAQRLIEQHREWSLKELAQAFGCRPAHFARLVRLNFLSPDIVTSILDGTHPATLTYETLIKAALPLDWSLQRRLLGFPPSVRKLPLGKTYGREVAHELTERWAS